MATVTIILRKDKSNKKGQHPIHFRIIKNRKVSYIASGQFVLPDQWDDSNNKVKPKHPNSKWLNSFLTNRYSELQDKVFEQELINKSNTTKQLKDKVFGTNTQMFFPFADAITQKYLNKGSVGTYDKTRSIIQKLKDYVNTSDLLFLDVDVNFIKKYEVYLSTKLKNKINTVHRDFKFIRQVFNEAVEQDIIEIQHNPFLKYKLKTEKTFKDYLTEEELIDFENVDTLNDGIKDIVKKMFVFATYAGGLRISDLLTLQWSNYDGERVSILVRKTRTQINIKLPVKAKEIVDSYKKENSRNEDFIFPMLKNELNLNDPRAVDSAISAATATINKNLKLIKAEAKINKHVSFHVSRHTFATRALRKGVSIDKVSKLMAHSNITQTQTYAKIVNEELDNAMDVFND